MARRLPTGDEIGELLFEFCVRGVAVSAHSKKRSELRKWQARVGARAKAAMQASAMIDGCVELKVTEFSERRTKDRDNVAKPIQDALQGVLFRNDRQVCRLEADWRDIDGVFRVRYISRVVAAALSTGDDFVWVRVYRFRQREGLMS